MSLTIPGVLRAAPPGDRELVSACLAGDEQAWAELVGRYKRLIFSIPLKRGMSAEEAADVFQAVCLDLVTELPRLRDPQALPSWLIQTTVRKVCRLKRREDRRTADDEALDALCAPESADALVHEVEREQALRTALNVLSPRCRQMVDMLFFETPPRPYRDVAATLGLAPGSIGFIRNRCLQRLRKELARIGL